VPAIQIGPTGDGASGRKRSAGTPGRQAFQIRPAADGSAMPVILRDLAGRPGF